MNKLSCSITNLFKFWHRLRIPKRPVLVLCHTTRPLKWHAKFVLEFGEALVNCLGIDWLTIAIAFGWLVLSGLILV